MSSEDVNSITLARIVSGGRLHKHSDEASGCTKTGNFLAS